jgi:hypothetical protein
MANIIKGNHDGENGRNDSYAIPGRGTVPRRNLVREVESGQHPDFSIYKTHGQEYIRANPDSSQDNNVNGG